MLFSVFINNGKELYVLIKREVKSGKLNQNIIQTLKSIVEKKVIIRKVL